jgi:hypothetical protein
LIAGSPTTLMTASATDGIIRIDRATKFQMLLEIESLL